MQARAARRQHLIVCVCVCVCVCVVHVSCDVNAVLWCYVLRAAALQNAHSTALFMVAPSCQMSGMQYMASNKSVVE